MTQYLVAPEYYFAESHEPGNKRQLSEKQKNYILEKLTELSIAFPTVLMIPGTIAWEEVLVSPDVRELGADSVPSGTAPVPHGNSGDDFEAFRKVAVVTGTDSSSKAYLAFKRRSGDSGFLEALEVLQKSDASMAGHGGDPRVPSNDRTTKTRTASRGYKQHQALRTMKAHNSAFIYLGGEQLSMYEKVADYQEVLGHGEPISECRTFDEYQVAVKRGDSVYIPGTKPNIIEIRNGDNSFVIGIEICLDHACDVLGKYLHNTSGSLLFSQPDIHLVLSASVETKSSCAKEDGYFIHSSSYTGSRCYFRGAEKLGVTKNKKSKYSIFQLNSVDLTLPARSRAVTGVSSFSSPYAAFDRGGGFFIPSAAPHTVMSQYAPALSSRPISSRQESGKSSSREDINDRLSERTFAFSSSTTVEAAAAPPTNTFDNIGRPPAIAQPNSRPVHISSRDGASRRVR